MIYKFHDNLSGADSSLFAHQLLRIAVVCSELPPIACLGANLTRVGKDAFDHGPLQTKYRAM